ncbi:MAG: helix-turn-helix domain-containing protein [Hyphomonadaceae bacterium]
MSTTMAYANMPSALSMELVEALLDGLPSAIFFVKDDKLRYAGANKAMLGLCGARSSAEIVGRTAGDFFAGESARRYEVADRRAMQTRRPVRDQLDLTVPLRGAPMWALQHRWPIVDGEGRALGVAVMARALAQPDSRHPIYGRIAAAVDHINANIGAPLDVADLARRAGVSVSQLERDFIALFAMPPRRYLAKVRLDAALELLLTDAPLAAIAHACGYTDQSAFARRFQAALGMSPSRYRLAHRFPAQTSPAG